MTFCFKYLNDVIHRDLGGAGERGGRRTVHFYSVRLASLFVRREMHALGRSHLECSSKIYVDLYEPPPVCDKFWDFYILKTDLRRCSVLISDCFG